MRKNIILIFTILLSLTGWAQDKITLDKVLNEQFGTLLETFLKDGKIDETNAKTYLETVFGYDEEVSKYLQTSDFVKQFGSLKQSGFGKLSTDNLITQLNSSLISFIPAEKQKAFMQHMEAQMLINNSLSEITSGKIGSNTLELTANIIQSSKDAKIERQKKEAIAKKLEAITPTLTKLNSNHQAYKKLKVVDDFSKYDNWILNSNPAVLREDNQNRYTINTSRIEGSVLKIATENYVPAVFNWDKETKFELFRFYKNIEKFDFSKDFTMNLYLSVGEKTEKFDIVLAKGYYVNFMTDYEHHTYISTHGNYQTSDNYGNLFADGTSGERYIKRNKEIEKVFFNDKEKKITVGLNSYNVNYMLYKNKKNPDIDFKTSVVKITISKVGNIFTCQLNDSQDLKFSNEISYFPDKYFLSFLVNGGPLSGKKGLLNIHKLELEHL